MQRILNASALMDIPFRSMRQQYESVYLAALEFPSNADVDVPSGVNMQQYHGCNLLTGGFDTFGSEDVCDPRFQDMGDNYSPITYDPRCRVWYQDAVESTTGEMIITDPYTDVDTDLIVVTPAAPVISATGDGILGVVGIDMNFREIQESIEGLKVLGGKGYAYLLAPEGNGTVAVHKDLGRTGNVRRIFDVEEGLDEESYRDILVEMTEQCSGEATYIKGGEEWVMSWEHEMVSGLSSDSGGSRSSDAVCVEGFVVVVTVSEAALFQVFDEVDGRIGNAVLVASLVMASILVALLCLDGVFAYAIAWGITRPVIQLLDMVSGLNILDFYRQEPGLGINNENASCPEVSQVVEAFKSIMTIVTSANLTIGWGDLDITRKVYEDPLILFTKLDNTRGVSIVNNNLGNVYTLQALELVQKAEGASSTTAGRYFDLADDKFDDAITCYRDAIADAEMVCSHTQNHETTCGIGAPGSPAGSEERSFNLESKADTDVGDEVDDSSSVSALKLQLMNRMFNLALCLAAKGSSLLRRSRGATGADAPTEPACISEARDLMWQCYRLAAERKDAHGCKRRVEYLIEIAALERQLPGRHEKACEALQEADGVALAYRGDPEESTAITNASERNEAYVSPRGPPLAVLRQRILVARAANSLAVEDFDAAVSQWDEAIVSCGYVMDPRVVEKALLGLRGQVDQGRNISLSPALRTGLGMTSGISGTCSTHESHEYLLAIEIALKKLEHITQKRLEPTPFAATIPTPAGMKKVDLCFVMDCTGSMQKWIDQSRNKLLDIIDQVREELADVELRVAYVGYRDLKDSKRFEGPYDFHTEENLPRLLQNLRNIRAFGGGDIPEDIAGGLDHVTRLSWRNPIRLCILIADAPCHGSMYHKVYDNYPGGCPSGKDPAQLLCEIQYQLGVDFYFIRITNLTDDMIKVFRSKLAKCKDKYAGSRGSEVARLKPPKFVVRKLGNNHSRFLEVVVENVKYSAGINFCFED